MTGPAPAIIGRAEAWNGTTEARFFFQQFHPVPLQFAVAHGIPNLQRHGETHQIIDVPMRNGRSLEMAFDSGAQASRPKRASDVRIKSRSEVECAESSNFHPFQLWNVQHKHVRPLFFRQFCAISHSVLLLQTTRYSRMKSESRRDFPRIARRFNAGLLSNVPTGQSCFGTVPVEN